MSSGKNVVDDAIDDSTVGAKRAMDLARMKDCHCVFVSCRYGRRARACQKKQNTSIEIDRTVRVIGCLGGICDW